MGCERGVKLQMRAKEQIEKGEKDAIGEEMERCIIEKETELINPFSSHLTNEQNQPEPHCIYHC